jgi:hypothetical protein
MRQDRGDAGADGIPLDQGDVADAHAGNVSDGVEWAGRQDAGRKSEVSGAAPVELIWHRVLVPEV